MQVSNFGKHKLAKDPDFQLCRDVLSARIYFSWTSSYRILLIFLLFSLNCYPHHIPITTVMSKDLEAGLTTATARLVIPSEYSSGQPVQPHTPLELFQLLVGIHTPSTLLQDASGNTIPKHRSATDRDDNIGLYQRAKDQERTSRYSYISTSFISNTLYMLQIILAATFTALSSYKETNAITLTALGAVNTVLAG